MTSAERPEADVAEQGGELDAVTAAGDRDANPADVLEQQLDAGLPDEDEAPR